MRKQRCHLNQGNSCWSILVLTFRVPLLLSGTNAKAITLSPSWLKASMGSSGATFLLASITRLTDFVSKPISTY